MTLEVDAGGTYLRANIYKNNTLQKSFKDKSQEVGLSHWLESILLQHNDIKTINISFAGQVKDGVILSAPNIKIDKADIKNYFESNFGVELSIQNDLNYAVLKEAEYFKCEDICAVYIGTGIGLGVVSSSMLITGKDGVATELGHIPYKETPFVCGCGKDNCIELFASGSALIRWKQHYNLDESLMLEDLKEMKHEIYTEFEKALLFAIATTITLFNPEVLVLGGGVIQSNPWLVEVIKDNIKKYAMPLSVKKLQVLQTKLDDTQEVGTYDKNIKYIIDLPKQMRFDREKKYKILSLNGKEFYITEFLFAKQRGYIKDYIGHTDLDLLFYKLLPYVEKSLYIVFKNSDDKRVSYGINVDNERTLLIVTDNDFIISIFIQNNKKLNKQIKNKRLIVENQFGGTAFPLTLSCPAGSCQQKAFWRQTDLIELLYQNLQKKSISYKEKKE